MKSKISPLLMDSKTPKLQAFEKSEKTKWG